MKITVQITVESAQGQPEVIQEVARLERGPLQPDTLGLSLAEARAILAGLEQHLVERQTAEFVAQERRCILLSTANFCGADLCGTDLTGAILRGVRAYRRYGNDSPENGPLLTRQRPLGPIRLRAVLSGSLASKELGSQPPRGVMMNSSSRGLASFPLTSPETTS